MRFSLPTSSVPKAYLSNRSIELKESVTIQAQILGSHGFDELTPKTPSSVGDAGEQRRSQEAQKQQGSGSRGQHDGIRGQNVLKSA
jgi:hypothetical protein